MAYESYPWHDDAPKDEGDFFYSGKTPEGREILAVVQVFVTADGVKQAGVFLPPNWRGLGGEAILHFGKIEEWKGQWSGPEHGLCCVSN